MTTNLLSTDWTSAQAEVMHRLRDCTVGFTELHQHVAAWMGLPGSDANALGQIVWADDLGAPLSPAELSRSIGMTSGAMTVLLNRLETAGHLHRSRESTDRRRVTLRPSSAARERVHAFLAVAGVEVAAVLRATGDDDLRVVVDFLGRISAAAASANERLAGR